MTWRRRTSSVLQPGKAGFYNLGNGDGYSVREVIQMCEKITGKKIPVVEKPRRPGDPPRLVASADKSDSRTGLETEIPEAGRHRDHRLGLAQKASQRLSGLKFQLTLLF